MNHQPRGPSGVWDATLSPRSRAPLIMGAVVLLIVIAFGTLLALALAHSNAVYAEFMDGCERDHKHYECMLLWRATRQDDPTMVPIPIPIPSTR